MKSRVLLTAAAAGLVCAQAFAATPAATPAGPWAKVPALPTICYAKDDPYGAKNEAAQTANSAARDKQAAINDGIKEKFNSEDPMQMAARLQQAMLDDPANAMKYMQGMQATGQEMQAEFPQVQEKERQLGEEEKALIKRYEAALQTAYKPGLARWNALKKKFGLDADAYGPGESGVPEWVWAEWNAIQHDLDQAYEAFCPQWWGTGGQMHAYMKRYRDFLVQERIPQYEKSDAATASTYAMFSTPAASYKSVAMFDAVEDYLQLASRVFSQRLVNPRCTTADDCNWHI